MDDRGSTNIFMMAFVFFLLLMLCINFVGWSGEKPIDNINDDVNKRYSNIVDDINETIQKAEIADDLPFPINHAVGLINVLLGGINVVYESTVGVVVDTAGQLIGFVWRMMTFSYKEMAYLGIVGILIGISLWLIALMLVVSLIRGVSVITG